MASREGIARVLRFLHALYPAHEVTDETGEAWLIVFADVSDEALIGAAKRCAKEPGRKFYPTVGEIQAQFDAMHPRVNATDLLKQIEGMGSYNAHTGWCWPRVEVVRDRFGDGIATAYGMVGPGRLASEDAVTRDIAHRDFAQEIKDVPPTETLLPILQASINPIVAQLAAKMDATTRLPPPRNLQ